jgi:hypothetical protein
VKEEKRYLVLAAEEAPDIQVATTFPICSRPLLKLLNSPWEPKKARKSMDNDTSGAIIEVLREPSSIYETSGAIMELLKEPSSI